MDDARWNNYDARRNWAFQVDKRPRARGRCGVWGARGDAESERVKQRRPSHVVDFLLELLIRSSSARSSILRQDAV
eukprot:scaffold115695_cov31-Tisochrysis_lutea.AAC.1